jgi:hypothetical protein
MPAHVFAGHVEILRGDLAEIFRSSDWRLVLP